ncbi:MAG: hypothetical protein WAM17_17250, partial [Rhodoplanes sp.]
APPTASPRRKTPAAPSSRSAESRPHERDSHTLALQPIIRGSLYFLGIAPGRYQAVLPSYIAGWDGKALKARVAFGMPNQETLAPLPETMLERRYALRAVKQRPHQASFREAVIAAYDGRCAVSRLPEPLLLDAAHIVEDNNELLGQPVVMASRSQKSITQLLTRI